MRSVEWTRPTRRAPLVGLAALLGAVALAVAACGSGSTTATAPSTTAPGAKAVETTTTDEPPTTDTPGAVSGAATLGGATGNASGDDASAVDAEDDLAPDDTTYEEGILAETGADEVAVDVTWATSATDYRGDDYLLVAYECPADGTLGSAWGTDAYTDDSSVCTAAVHLGLISEVDGGLVVIQISDGLESYEGSTANGVTTGSYAAWEGTFTFVS